MKITDIQCIHVQIPKVSTNIIGGSVSYEGNPYRDEEPEHMNQFVGSVPHFGHSCSGIVKVYTDEGIVGIGEAATETTRCEIDRIRDNLIGCDVYDNTDTAHLAAMYATDSLSLNKRMLALTECAVYPDPDIMARDNAMWLWTAMWNGKYLINESGELTGDYISVEQLKKFYNHEATVTRDEIGKQKE